MTSIIIAYVFYPAYKKIKALIKHESLSIFITLIAIVVIFLIPFAFIAAKIPGQISTIYGFAKENVIDKGFFDFNCENVDTKKCDFINFADSLEFFNFNSILNSVFKGITQFAADIVKSIPNLLIGIGFALFISYFLFKDGKKLVSSIVDIIPLERKSSNKLVEQFGRVTHSVVFAHLIVAIVQGALGTIGFYIFGIPSPIFWGVVMAIFALLPVIGTAIIWVPASLFLIINGAIANSYIVIGKGIGLFLFGLLIISTVDNILRVKIVGGSGEVHPLTVLIGLIGGVNLFGLTGIFIGPIILSLIVTYLKDFSKRYKEV